MFMQVRRKTFFAFCWTLHESFSNSYGFGLCKNLVFSILTKCFMIGNIFVQSWLIGAKHLFLFHKIKQWMWRMLLPNSFQKCRSSRSQMFSRSSLLKMFCKNAVLRDFPKFTRKDLCQSLFITKVAGQARQLYLKRDPVSWCFLLILWNLEENLFLRNTPVAA